ncbi:MAG: CoA pyrophosphatase [Thaumarchaeota archaeon]|nr:CoA pyrophosphatase [Nitrososphaerota archaeon]
MLELEKLQSVLASLIDTSMPKNPKTKLAAVLVVIYGPKPSVIMTERPKTMDHHAGEISFPGGRHQDDDPDLLSTALRETKEEIGAEIPRKQVIGQLKPVTTLNSGFTISPFITIQEKIPKITPNSEIESILEIPLIPLLRTLEDDRDPEHHSIQEMYTFKFQDHLIWGASARILHQIYLMMSSNRLL